MKPVFRLDRVVKRYGRQTALDHLSLESPAGAVVALLGDNGAGKTTALRLLLGLIEADEGQAEVLGLDNDAASWVRADFDRAATLVTLLLLSGRQLQADGELDEALERYISALRLARHVAHRGSVVPWTIGNQLQSQVCQWLPLWAAEIGQEPQKIAAALQRIEKETAGFPLASDALKVENMVFQQLLSLDLTSQSDLLLAGRPVADAIELNLMNSLAPWEWERARRVLNVLTNQSLHSIDKLEHLLAQPGTDLVHWRRESFLKRSRSQLEIRAWERTTPLLAQGTMLDANSLVIRRVDTQAYRSACLLTLALLKWRLEKGQLPARLEDLDTNTFYRFGVDPWSGQQFGYRPDRSAVGLKFGNVETVQPILWSAGAEGARVITTGMTAGGLPRYFVLAAGQELDQHRAGQRGIGLAFPIP